MELENQVIEQVQTETVETVSTEEPKVETKVEPVVEWKAPQTKEEFEAALKSAENKKATELLKSLGVKGVKEFKELQAKVDAERLNIEKIISERDTQLKTAQELEAKYNNLVQENLLNDLNIEKDYREDLLKLARERVDATHPLESVLKEMIQGKYKYAVSNHSPIKMGTEKSEVVKDPNEVSEQLVKKYPWLKG